MKGIFITGTDTSVGKTVVTGLLGRYLKEKGLKVATQKWIQTGCMDVSEDILEHDLIMGRGPDNATPLRMPYILKYPASPHLASRLDDVKINVENIKAAFNELLESSDVVLAEGAGGLLVPVNEEVLIADIVKDLDIPAILVVENRLGAINQALLTIESMKRRGIRLLGIVFNRLTPRGDEMILNDNKDIIAKISGVTVFGELGYKDCRCADHADFDMIGDNVYKEIR